MIHAAITLLRSLPPGRLAMLFALMLAAALSEGVGLLMLVPMLSLLSGGESVAAGLPGWAAGLVLAMADGPGIAGLLGIFVALVAARAVLTFRLGVLQMQIQHRLEHQLEDQHQLVHQLEQLRSRLSEPATSANESKNKPGIQVELELEV